MLPLAPPAACYSGSGGGHGISTFWLCRRKTSTCRRASFEFASGTRLTSSAPYGSVPPFWRGRSGLYPGKTFSRGAGEASLPSHGAPGPYAMPPSPHEKRSEIRSLRWARDVTWAHDDFSAAAPAKQSALSFPGVPACPLTHAIWVVRPPEARLSEMKRWIDSTLRWPGPAPE